MKAFEFVRPETIAEASALLGERETGSANGTALLAGGTDLLTLMKADLYAPERLVDIKRLAELDNRIEEDEDGLAIGALVTLAQFEDDPRMTSLYPALAEASAPAATPQLRHMATIGGNLLQRPRRWCFRNPRVQCWLKGGDACQARQGENQRHALFDVTPCVAVHPSDSASALLAINAVVRLRGASGERDLPVAEIFSPRRLPSGARKRSSAATSSLPQYIPQGDGSQGVGIRVGERGSGAADRREPHRRRQPCAGRRRSCPLTSRGG